MKLFFSKCCKLTNTLISSTINPFWYILLKLCCAYTVAVFSDFVSCEWWWQCFITQLKGHSVYLQIFCLVFLSAMIGALHAWRAITSVSSASTFYYLLFWDAKKWVYATPNGCGWCSVQVMGRVRWVVWCSQSQKYRARRKRSSWIRGSRTVLLAEMSVFVANQWLMDRQRLAPRQKCRRNSAIALVCGLEWTDSAAAAVRQWRGWWYDDDDYLWCWIW